MSSEERDVQDEQQTPAGQTVPIPSRDAVFRDLGKVAKAKPQKRPAKDESEAGGGAAQE